MMSTTALQPATTPIPVQLSEPEFTAFILPYSELTPCSRNTKFYAALRVFPIFTFTLCSTWFVMTRNRNACCS